MTERLRDNPDDLEALVGITAEALGMPAVYVEKDFWVTEVLRAASIDRSVEFPDGSTVTHSSSTVVTSMTSAVSSETNK